MIEEFYFGLACEYKDDNEPMILVGNIEKVRAENLSNAGKHYRAKHKLQLGWNGKKSPFKVVRIIED